MFVGQIRIWSLRVLALPILFVATMAGAARADQTWLECNVTHSASHSNGATDSEFSMTMVIVYDSNGGVWTYYPSNQRLNPVAGAQVDGGKITWQPPSNGQSESQPTTIDLNSGEYHASNVTKANDDVITQTESGLCQTAPARSVIEN